MLIKNHTDLRSWVKNKMRFSNDETVEAIVDAIDFDVNRSVSFTDNWTSYLGTLPNNLMELLR